MRLPFRIVDVFTDRPLAGNQLCVVPEPGSITSQTMQAIAREIGFSETTFVTWATRDRYEMRIFTPATELPFAGHPSLGTAFVLAAEGRTRTSVIQSVTSGEMPIEVDLQERIARMEQLPPIFRPPVDDTSAVLGATGLKPDDLIPELPCQVVSTGLAHLLVPVASEETVRWTRPDLQALTELLERAGASGAYLFAIEEGDIHARLFAPGLGVEQDAATGSAAGPLGAYLVEHGVVPPGLLTISQGQEIGRPSTLQVEIQPGGDGWRVFVSGGVVIVGEGVFILPD
jgi:trans-2,3-dihydro-3-hydroxyanthranilate isomerase